MIRLQRGFTLVELMLVIVVMGILASVVYVTWSGAVGNARDRARETDTRQWAASFDAYKARFFIWPLVPTYDSTGSSDGVNGDISSCLGAPKSSDGQSALTKCVQYSSSDPTKYLPVDTSSGSTYMTILNGTARIGNTPVNNGYATNSVAAGPFVYLWQKTDKSGGATNGNATVTGLFINFFENSCPKDFLTLTTPVSISGDSADYVPLNALFTGLTSVKICGLLKTLSYNPNNSNL